MQGLRDAPLTVSELIEASGMKQANVSKHPGALYHHRLVRRQPEGICVRYEIMAPVVFALCNLACEKVGGVGKKLKH